MSQLLETLKARLEFNPRVFSNTWVRRSIGMPIPHGANSGAQVENARLAPIHAALVRCVELLILVKETENKTHDGEVFCSVNALHFALATLESALKENA